MIRRVLAALLLAMTLAVPAGGQECGPSGCPTAPSGPTWRPDRPVRSAARETSPNPAVCRIVVYARQSQSWGTGTLIASDLVLTCYHLVRDGADRIELRFNDGNYLGRLLAVDEANDLSAIEIRPTTIPPATVSAGDPRPGEALRSGGFGRPQEGFGFNRGTVLGYATADHGGAQDPSVVSTRKGASSNTMLLTGSAREGDSGGPVLDADGQLVGVIWGTDERTVSATSCLRIRGFLARLRDRLAQRRRRRQPQGPAVPTKPPVVVTPEAEPPLVQPVQPVVPVVPVVPLVPDPRLAEPAPVVPIVPTPPTAPASVPATLPMATSLLGPAAVTAMAAATGFSPLAIWGVFLAVRTLRKRRLQRRAARPPALPDTPAAVEGGPAGDAGGVFQRDLTEAQQLLQLSELEGRSPLCDAIVGRFADDELANAAELHAGEPKGDWAAALRAKLKRRFNEVAPLAAYPNATTQGV